MISTRNEFKVLGKSLAVDGDMTVCLRAKVMFPYRFHLTTGIIMGKQLRRMATTLLAEPG